MRYHILRRASGTGSSAPTTSAADWQARISGSGVVWYHDFSTAAEVDQFRYVNGYGHDPNDVARPNQTIWLADDGITGGCMESRHSGTQNPPDWWRPMAPLVAGSNGRAIDDPAANSSLTKFTWTPNPAGGDAAKTAFESRGHYGNPIYHGSEPAGTFNGTSYYIQLRVKISANRATAGIGSDEGGKLLYCTNTWASATSQEIVINSYVEVTAFGEGRNLFSMYRSVSPPLADDHVVSGLRQVGGEYNGGICRSSPTVNHTGCWFWPTDETSEGEGRYVTILKQVIPGTDSGGDTVVRVWKAEWGETSYTKIWDQSDVDLPFAAGHPFGHNAIICSGFQNSIDFTEEVYHRYAQIIFSHDFIACPQVYEEPVSVPAWASATSLDTWGPLGSDTFTRVGAPNIGQNGTGNSSMVLRAWNGAAVMNYGAHKSVGLYGGGHQDYYGNEFYRFDLSTLLYERMTNPSLANGGSWAGPFTNGILSDGTPNVPHTYNFQCGRGSTFVLGKRQVTNTPSSVNMISVFNPATLQWTNSIANHGISPTAYDGMCYDSARDLVWLVQSGGGNFGWASYNFNTDTWTSYSQPTGNFSEPGVGPVYVAGKDMVLCFVNATNTLLGLDPGSPTTDKVTLTSANGLVTGTFPPVVSRGSGACWSSNLNAVVYWPENANTIYLLTPPAGDWRTGTWTWSQRSVTGTSGNHTGNGAFNKFQVVEWGSVTVAVLIDDHLNAPRGVRLS